MDRQSINQQRDRAIGALVGLAIGDAIGTTLEFRTRDTYEHVTDMIGGGPFQLKPGQWTDDTAMALALADSLDQKRSLDEADLLNRFCNWWQYGEYSCTGECFDIGITTRAALSRWLATDDPLSGSTDPDTAGNGSLMRLAPVALRYWNDSAKLCDVAARQSRTTHGAAEAVDSCVAFAGLLADAITHGDRLALFDRHPFEGAVRVQEILSGEWRHKARAEIRSSGYVIHSLEAALWCVWQTDYFADAVLLAANLGDDADTVAAITGQLAGALYGRTGIAETWIDRLAWSAEIQGYAERLFDTSLAKD